VAGSHFPELLLPVGLCLGGNSLGDQKVGMSWGEVHKWTHPFLFLFSISCQHGPETDLWPKQQELIPGFSFIFLAFCFLVPNISLTKSFF
jgi:hypothetical protein